MLAVSFRLPAGKMEDSVRVLIHRRRIGSLPQEEQHHRQLWVGGGGGGGGGGMLSIASLLHTHKQRERGRGREGGREKER